jgi:uncharacterized membrane protein
MDPNTIKAASDAMKPLLDKLGQLGAKGFELAIRQNYVYALQDALWICVSLIFMLVVWLFLRGLIRAEKEDAYKLKGKIVHRNMTTDDEGNLLPGVTIVKVPCYKGIFDYGENGRGDSGWVIIVMALVVGIGLIVICAVSFAMIPRLLNPEYMALKDILGMLSSTTVR